MPPNARPALVVAEACGHVQATVTPPECRAFVLNAAARLGLSIREHAPQLAPATISLPSKRQATVISVLSPCCGSWRLRDTAHHGQA